ncbi:colicin- partial : HNH nuclease OS=Citrobacter freundii GN=MC47_21750 PE=4 SV=1: PT-HINT: Colicin-DNase [Tuwongella immobilis]|uniref:HNH endonuclease n=1 Tax=Tuwongella immobilis TaxID=692036 RepID=A0A6C2YI70_9BACT|nr:colicin- partial : HNH nuclease OS=Citrobacter freundii GN=MC47_21750 PE=4 SV=1: PT-HINT: Colicin-DNase [Tuwongella immobilis]VTR97553.1 colicin- partial : HNH nuclease OS=Citrobacter freundii GN=MC47_21750 PE=4 SV=1: PT-HINT: Colicin-DNase [Tuwongella immobilis]
MSASELSAGDRLLGHDGCWVPLDGIEIGDSWSVVYNLRVAEDHTYFVGCDEWGFSLWAHNQSCGDFINELEQAGTITKQRAAAMLADPAFQKLYDEFIALRGPNAAAELLGNPALAGGSRGDLASMLRRGMQEVDPTIKTDMLRNAPGAAHGGEGLPGLTPGGVWLDKATGSVGRVPQEVASQLRGRSFTDWRNFRQEFWKAVGAVPELLAQFKPDNQARILAGKPPTAPKAGHLGNRRGFELDHMDPLDITGPRGVYDLDNIMVAPAKVNLSFESF